MRLLTFACGSRLCQFILNRGISDRRKNRIPNGISELLKTPRKPNRFPALNKLSRLYRRLFVAFGDVNSVETWLVNSSFRSRTDKFSYVNDITVDPLSQISEALVSLVACKGETSQGQRIRYAMLLHRLHTVILDYVSQDCNEKLMFVENLGHKLLTENGNVSVIYMYWLILVKNSSKFTTVSLLYHKYSNQLMKCLREELAMYVGEVQLQDFVNITLCVGSVELFVDLVLTKHQTIPLSHSAVVMLQSYKSLALWKSKKNFEGLKGIELTIINLLEFIQQDQTIISRCADFVICFSDIVCDIVLLEEAENIGYFEFLDGLSNKFDHSYVNFPLLSYIMWIHYFSCSSSTAKVRARSLSDKIHHLRDERFEKSLTASSMTRESKFYFVSTFLNNLEQKLYKSSLDDSLSREIALGRLDDAVALVLKSAAGVFPSCDTLKDLVNAILLNKKSSILMHELKNYLPLQSDEMDQICHMEVSFYLKSNHRDTTEDNLLHGIANVILCYRSLLENDYRISFKTLDSLMLLCKQYLRFYLEEDIKTGTCNGGIRQAKKMALDIVNVFQDYRILAIVWEVLFYTRKFALQCESEDFLQEFPLLARQLNFDYLLDRACRQSHDDTQRGCIRRLLEISLRYDLDGYEKSRCFQVFLSHLCDRGDLGGAETTLAAAKSLGIPISADSMASVLELKSCIHKTNILSFLSKQLFSHKTKIE